MKLDEEKLKQVGIDCISLRIYASKRIEYILEEIEEWSEFLNPQDKYLIPTFIEIIGMSTDRDEEKLIGKIVAYFFEPEILMNDSDFWEVCDAESGDLEAMASAIIEDGLQVRDEICPENASVFYIDEIFINKEYRDLDIGSYLLQNLKDFLYYSSNLNIGAIVTMPYAMEGTVEKGYHSIEDKKQRQETLKGLIYFFEKNGFKQVDHTKYYYKRLVT